MKFIDLSLDQFDEFYQIVLTNFPIKEIKDYEYMKDGFIRKRYQVLTLDDKGRIAGIMVYFNCNDFLFVDYFAIDKPYQNKGLGSKMLKYFINEAKLPVILEVEYPDDEICKKRIAFYKRNGMILNDDLKYFVPPVRNLKQRLYFHLMSYPKALNKKDYDELYLKILNLVYEL